MTDSMFNASSPITATARGIAADVRTAQRSARQVLEGHLATIAVRETEVHAFNLVLG